MNAETPGAFAPKAARPADSKADGVHITMDFDDVDPAPDTGDPAQRDRPADPQPDSKPRAATRPSGPAVPPLLAGIEVRLSVEVGSVRLPLKELMAIEPGQLFALDRMAAEPVSVLVNGKPFARGEIVAIGERFGIRLLDILPAAD